MKKFIQWNYDEAKDTANMKVTLQFAIRNRLIKSKFGPWLCSNADANPNFGPRPLPVLVLRRTANQVILIKYIFMENRFL